MVRRRYNEEKADEGKRNLERGSEGGLDGQCMSVQREGWRRRWGGMETRRSDIGEGTREGGLRPRARLGTS